VWESDFAENNQPVRVANPIAAHMEVMRSGLIGGLVNVAKHNLNHGESRLQLFEIGRCFLSAEANVQAQPERVAGFILGSRYPEQWGEDKSAKVDFFDIKGDAQNLLQGLPVRFEQDGHPALHPGRAARIVVNGERAGFVGELHPKLTQKYGLPSAPLIFELDLSAISTVPAPAYQPISRMPAVRRDIAVLVDDSVSVQAIIDAVLARKMASLIDFSVFDLYRGANLEAGRKSVAFRIVMQDTDRTLTDSETDQIVANIVEVISQKFGATLRK
jgi:phenylalanyl-tRNA synthetase beta chain